MYYVNRAYAETEPSSVLTIRGVHNIQTLSARGVAMKGTDHFIRSCLLLGMVVVAARCYTVEKGVSEVHLFYCKHLLHY